MKVALELQAQFLDQQFPDLVALSIFPCSKPLPGLQASLCICISHMLLRLLGNVTIPLGHQDPALGTSGSDPCVPCACLLAVQVLM